MLLARVSTVILALSALLTVSTALPLLDPNQRHIISVTADALEPSPEAKPFESNTFIHGVPDEFFLKPSPLDPLPHEFHETENNSFGLRPSDATQPEKTILLNHGEAKFNASFTLILREGEDIRGMRHSPNDTSIITSFEDSRERNPGSLVSYNITIAHHFKGTVGVAEYELTVFTTMGATFRVRGKYRVAGIVVYASTPSKPLEIVSGSVLSPFVIESVYSLSHMLRQGLIMLPIKFQQVGPDVSLSPASPADVLSTAQITVVDVPSDGMPTLMINALKCTSTGEKLSIRQTHISEWRNCDVGFDSNSMTLVLRVHPERYGNAIISIALPGIRTQTEIFKTEIRLSVSNPVIRRPEVVMEQDIHLLLDYYGTESFSLNMTNLGTSDQRRDVVSYVIDLPGNKYATADFPNSSLAGSAHTVLFTVVSPGQENKMIQEKIRHALMDLADSTGGDTHGQDTVVQIRRLQHHANQSHIFNGLRENSRSDKAPFDFSSLTLYDDEYSAEFDVISVGRAEERPRQYNSHVHAVLRSFDALVTAQASSLSTLWTTFSSKKLAMVQALRVRTDSQNILVKLILLRYTISTFSQHKSIQISKYLSKEVSMLYRVKIHRASLVTLEDKGLNIEATYHVLIPEKYPDGFMVINKHKMNISSRIAENMLLRDGRLNISEVVRLAVLGRPTGTNSTTSESTSRHRGLNGTLLAVFIVLALVIAALILTVCVGYFIARRHRDKSSSSFGDDAVRELTQKDRRAQKSREDPRTATDVLRDNYGRADED